MTLKFSDISAIDVPAKIFLYVGPELRVKSDCT